MITILAAIGAWAISPSGIETIVGLIGLAAAHYHVSNKATATLTAAAPDIIKGIVEAAKPGQTQAQIVAIAAATLKKEVPTVTRILAPSVSAQATALVNAHLAPPPKGPLETAFNS